MDHSHPRLPAQTVDNNNLHNTQEISPTFQFWSCCDQTFRGIPNSKFNYILDDGLEVAPGKWMIFVPHPRPFPGALQQLCSRMPQMAWSHGFVELEILWWYRCYWLKLDECYRFFVLLTSFNQSAEIMYVPKNKGYIRNRRAQRRSLCRIPGSCPIHHPQRQDLMQNLLSFSERKGLLLSSPVALRLLCRRGAPKTPPSLP